MTDGDETSGRPRDPAAPDPERLLAEALRAQAVRTPLPDRAAGPVAGTGSLGLLSGASPLAPEFSSTSSVAYPQQAGPSDSHAGPVGQPGVGGRGPLPAGWVLLLAVLLGLVAGAVIGLITLI